MPTKLCPKCHGQRTILCLACHGTGKKIPVGNCKECGGTGRRICDVCSGTGEVETLARHIQRATTAANQSGRQTKTHPEGRRIRDDILVLNFCPRSKRPESRVCKLRTRFNRQTRACTSREPNLWRPG